MNLNGIPVDDTFAEAFENYYSRFLITAHNKKWAGIAAREVTGFASSVIGCTAEGGIEGFLDLEETPDGRPGAVVQLWTSRKKMLHELLDRIGQCVLTSPSAAVFDWCGNCEKIDVGKKMGFFGDGFSLSRNLFGREMISIPLMMGEFLIEKDLGVSRGVAGGNFLIMSSTLESALEAGERASEAVQRLPGVITSFPGGICASGSKVGAKKYKFMKATTNELYCPNLREKVTDSKVPAPVNSIAEIVINGISEDAVRGAMKEGIEAAVKVEGVKKISAANYGGSLGGVHIKLKSLWR
jgi:formylmethanofuran--tetrahydromethanopterin N-formyltransferase